MDPSTNIVLPPTPAVVATADALDELMTRRIAGVRRETGPDWTQWEAGFCGFALFSLVVRQVEAVLVLARHDLALLAPAVTTARSAVETSIRLWWMCAPQDTYVREVRWVALAREQEEFHARAAKRLLTIPGLVGSAAEHEREKQKIGHFLDAVADKLRSKGYEVSSSRRPPNLSDMLTDLGQSARYLNYVSASQFAHGTLLAGRLYQQGETLGEFTSSSQWRMPLSMCSAALDQPVSVYLERYRGGDTDTADCIQNVNEMIRALGR